MLAYEIDLRLPGCRTLKDKRRVIKPIIEGARRRFEVSAAEIAHPDATDRATLGFAVVTSTARLATQVIDDVDRFVWSFPEIQVIDADRRWLE